MLGPRNGTKVSRPLENKVTNFRPRQQSGVESVFPEAPVFRVATTASRKRPLSTTFPLDDTADTPLLPSSRTEAFVDVMETSRAAESDRSACCERSHLPGQ